jgi:hypothetical protein
MNFLKQGFGLLIIVSTISFLCVALVSVMTQVRASNGLYGKKPSVELRASKTSITYPCRPDAHSMSGSCPSEFDPRVSLTALANNFNKRTVYSYTVTAGQIVGEGTEVTWDFSGVRAGYYTATVDVQDNKKHRVGSSLIVKVVPCSDCVFHDLPCGTISVDCYDQVTAGTPITCKVIAQGIAFSPIKYEWSARDSSGEDLSERIRGNGEYISIPTNDLAGRTVYARVDLKGLDPSCNSTASSSTKVKR